MGTLNIDMIREYLVEVGCKVEYPILVNAFKKHLYNSDPNLQGKIRTQFKDYVNRLATVSLENNMKFINLRSEFVPPRLKAQQPTGGQVNVSQQAPHVSHHGVSRVQEPKHHLPERPDLNQLQAHGQQHARQYESNNQYSSPKTNVVQSPSHAEKQHSPIIIHQLRQQPDISQFAQNGNAFIPPISLGSPNRMQTIPNSPNSPLKTQYYRPQHEQSLQQHQQAFFQPLPQQEPIPQPIRHIQPVPNQRHKQEHRLSRSTSQSFNEHSTGDKENRQEDNPDGNSSSAFLMPPPPIPPAQNRSHHYRSLSMQQQHFQAESMNVSVNEQAQQQQQQMPPPRPPPRRRQSTASMFKPPAGGIKLIAGEFANNGNTGSGLKKEFSGHVREHAFRLNSNNASLSSLTMSASSTNDLHNNFHSQQQLSTPKRNDSLNRLSRDSAAFISGLSTSGLSAVKLQRNGSYLTTRSRSSHRGEDESDSSSLQPTIDPLRRKWAIEACSCNYNGLITLLREDPKLASYKDIVNGYTALHWAAKFGNLDIIKLIAGTHGVSTNIKSSAGQTPLHVAYIFNRLDAARLLLESYRANSEVRDHSGKRPMQYYQAVGNRPVKGVNCINNYNNGCLTTA